jgi:hypothetical protein
MIDVTPLTQEEEEKLRESIVLLGGTDNLQWTNSALARVLATLDRDRAAAKAEGWSEGYRAARLAGALDEEAAR